MLETLPGFCLWGHNVCTEKTIYSVDSFKELRVQLNLLCSPWWISSIITTSKTLKTKS